MKTLRNNIIADAGKGILIETLFMVKTHWELSEDLVASLEREMSADPQNFQASSKLILLRIV